jgi:hypothetical protein
LLSNFSHGSVAGTQREFHVGGDARVNLETRVAHASVKDGQRSIVIQDAQNV